MNRHFFFTSVIILTILTIVSGYFFNNISDEVLFEFFDDFHEISEEKFDQELRFCVNKSPYNSATGRHQLMLLVTNQGLLNFAKNCLCSLWNVQGNDDSYVIVALDAVSYVSLKALGANVLYFSSKLTADAVNYRKKREFYDIVKVRPYIAKKILNLGAEVIICDIDIVFIQNTTNLFKNGADLEVQSDSKVFTEIPFNKNLPYWGVNLGFYKAIPSPAVLALWPVWQMQMHKMPESHDQMTLYMILRQKLKQLDNHPVLLADIRKFLGYKSFYPIVISYLDPMLAVNAGGVFLAGKERWKYVAKVKNISKPVFVHFFHLSENEDKLKLMKSKKLWFLNSDGKCSSVPPAGAKWPYWN
ncbi:hypothetical protein TVAG_208930 [Trichomonas vaginalis G3]|uniref:Nucleotide-diphospho-sugar transferase domain-containing protein n=1 Tax=Trichomonas vaginalis (strain ATCC PRA-98 / G3) TaxID=412133 RepID=A2DVD5_TRIV3|nr:UDP-D-xylose:L-fucose alpha-1,3-D-xylosyltransferase-related family [Trichomonas vaginalis G3]EAY15614.1 hypothetical protein TVAG_208930 [Trichomonas vaginalis G3]KAI5530221.1 UDP-D-xylose:L-fucose alpha-1,3-D-xylosyltransferase-related family [Trichomonas vaginalis G3]|eukprot:XP_001327837.1 hypothetical protein [Trichomonas vaginalis G3]